MGYGDVTALLFSHKGRLETHYKISFFEKKIYHLHAPTRGRVRQMNHEQTNKLLVFLLLQIPVEN